MGYRFSFLLVLSVLVGACETSLEVDLSIHDACNQYVLSEAKHIEVEIASQSESLAKHGVIWNAREGQGQLPEVGVISDAVVSVVARDSNASGNPGEAFAGSTVGVLDLTKPNNTEGTVDLNVVIGEVDTFINTTQTANPRICSELIAERHDHTATALGDGRVFIAGGVRRNVDSTTYWETTEMFEPASGDFRQSQPMAWMRRGHTATLLNDGRVLLVGGLFYSTSQDGQPDEQTWVVAHLFDSKSDDFKTPVKMVAQRAYHTATELSDGRVLIVGGRFEGNALGTTEIFDPVTDTSVPGPTLSNARYNHLVVRIAASTVAVLGGQGDSGVLDTVEFLTAGDASSVVATGKLSQARAYAVGGLVANAQAILIAGGFGAALSRPEAGAGLDSIEVFEINRSDLASSGTLCGGTTLSMSSSRGYASAHQLSDGMLVVGGIDEGGAILQSAEILRLVDLESCQISSTSTRGSMSQARAGGVLSELIGGDILVTGGIGSDGDQVISVAQPEIYVVPR